MLSHRHGFPEVSPSINDNTEQVGDLVLKEKKYIYIHIQGPAQVTPLFYCKIFYYKIIGMQFCNIRISHSSTPYGILGEMFKVKL